MRNKFFKLLAIIMLVLMVFSSCDLEGPKKEEHSKPANPVHQHKIEKNFNDERNQSPTYFTPGTLWGICTDCKKEDCIIIPSTLEKLIENPNAKEFKSEEFTILKSMTSTIGTSIEPVAQTLTELLGLLFRDPTNLRISENHLKSQLATVAKKNYYKCSKILYYSDLDTGVFLNLTPDVSFTGSFNFGFAPDSKPYRLDFTYSLTDELTYEICDIDESYYDADELGLEEIEIEQFLIAVLANAEYSLTAPDYGITFDVTLINGSKSYDLGLSLNGDLAVSQPKKDKTVFSTNNLKLAIKGLDLSVELELNDASFAYEFKEEGSEQLSSFTLSGNVGLSIKCKDEVEVKTEFNLNDTGLNLTNNRVYTSDKSLDYELINVRGYLKNETSVIVGDNKVSVNLDATPWVKYNSKGETDVNLLSDDAKWNLGGTAVNELTISLNDTAYDWDSIALYFMNNDTAGENLLENLLSGIEEILEIDLI